MSELRDRFPPPALMGIVNVTPDSFSDGGSFLDPTDAIAHGRSLADEGADVLDVGGESTRPGSDPVPVAEELRRVLPVVRELAAAGPPVSIDTMKAEVAVAALAAGAAFVNDVTALRNDPRMAAVVADAGVPVCLMHMLGDPKTMQDAPAYGDVVGEVREFLARRADGQPAEVAHLGQRDVDAHLHADLLGVELERLLLVVHPELSVGDSDHGFSLLVDIHCLTAS